MSEQTNIELDSKLVSKRLYLKKKKSPQRFNTKEVKARKAKEVARKMQAVRKEILPHLEEEDSSQVPLPLEQEEPFLGADTIAYRNSLARLAVDTPSASKPRDDDGMFERIMGAVSGLTKQLDLNETTDEISEWVGHIENIAIFSYQMYRARSFVECFVAVTAYMKMYMKSRSVVLELMKLIGEIPGETCDDVLPESEDVSTVPSSWSQTLKLRWNLLRTNTVYTKISYLISAAMSLTICSLKEITWSPLGVKLIHIEAAKKQAHCLDIIDAIVETFTWIAETGWQVFHTKSLEPLLYSDQSIASYNADFDYVIAYSATALAGNVADLNDFEKKVDAALRRTSFLQKAKPDSITAIWLQKRYVDLVTIKERLVCKHRNTMVRFQPIGFSLHGGTGVGKTTLGKMTMNTSLHAMGYSTDRGRQITHDSYDAYQSTYTSDVEGLFLDDVANLKADFAQGTQIPSAAIIKFFNNVAAQAVKAELNEKGVVFVNFKCGVVTTNSKELDARTYSNCPESILRRLYHVHVRVKPQFRVPGGSSLNTQHPDIMLADMTKDIWQITVEECVSSVDPGTGKSALRFVPIRLDVRGRSVSCIDLNLEEYLHVVAQLSKNHKFHQENLLRSNDKFEHVLYCACGLPSVVCSVCKDFTPEQIIAQLQKKAEVDALLLQEKRDKELEQQRVIDSYIKPESLEVITDLVRTSITKALTNYVQSWIRPMHVVNSMLGFSPIRLVAERSLIRELEINIDSVATPFLVAITPDCVYRTRMFQKFSDFWRSAAAYRDLKHHAYALSGATIFSCVGLLSVGRPRTALCCAGAGWIGSIGLWQAWLERKRMYLQQFVASRTALTTQAQRIRSAIKPSTVLCGATLVLGVKLLCMWNEHRKLTMLPDSSDMTPEKIDLQPGWFGMMMQRVGLQCVTQPPSASADTDQVLATLEKNLMLITVVRDDGTMSRTNVFFPKHGVCWIPRHVLHKDGDMSLPASARFTATVTRHSSSGGKFTFKADSSSWYVFPNHDLLAVYVPNCPDLKDLTKWLPVTAPIGSAHAFLKRRLPDLTVTQQRVFVTLGKYGHRYMQMLGGAYHSSIIGSGSCMAPLVKDGKHPFIMGFHIGGGDSQNGVMQNVTLAAAQCSYAALELIPNIVLSASEGILPEAQYGRPVVTGPTHPKAHALTYTSSNYIEVLGACKVRRTQRSMVEESILSPLVTQVCGVSNNWGPPQLNPNWVPYNVALDLISQPTDMFYPSELLRAHQDYLAPLERLMLEHRSREEFHPLDEHAMVCGIDGKRFVDPIPMNTSMGFPLFGTKERYFHEIRDGQQLKTRTIGPEIREEMDRLLSCWRDGKRGYPVLSACLKDEPTKRDKTKVRVFLACPVAFGLFVRKYFLPIARFFGLHPITAEMAVGVNAFGTQWQELAQHMQIYSPDGDGLFGMDYEFYDARMNSQITRDTLVSMITLAKIGGYKNDDLYIMKMMIADLVHPVIEINGTIVKAYAMNPTGNNITVQLNCLGNSKYVRLAAFAACPEEESFRAFVSIMTYGDDNSGSVKSSHRERFNFLVCQQYLAKHGVVITPPDKKSVGKAFFASEELDFLKRQSVYIPEIGRTLGALNEMSIFKSLHANLRSKHCTRTEIAVSCIEGAMHEWFAHGKEKYTVRASQMKQICQQLDLLVPAVDATFEERVALWNSNYCQS